MTDYWVDPVSGSDGAAGTSFGAAWATTQKAADTTVGGDRVFLSATGTESPSARIDFDTNAGSADSPIEYIGADASGVELTSGVYTISGGSLPATTDLIYFNVTNIYIKFKRVRFTGGTRDGLTNGTAGYYITLDTCRIDNFASDGIYWTSTGAHFWMFNTEVDNNTGRGTGINAAGRFNVDMHFCNIHDNGGMGAEIGGDSEAVSIVGNIFDTNGGDNVRIRGAGASLINNTSYNATGDCFSIEAANTIMLNNSASSGSGWGFNINTSGDDMLNMRNNHTYNNTSGASNITLPGDGNQTGDPSFADAAGGDFQPSAASPLTDNALGGGDIGAVKAAGAGAGGIAKHVGQGGGLIA